MSETVTIARPYAQAVFRLARESSSLPLWSDRLQRLALIAQDEMFHLDEAALEASLEPSKYVGCSAHQVERFLNDVIRPLLKENEADLGMKAEINV